MAFITCPQCGEKISDESKTCIHCGYDLSNLQAPKGKVCPKCGAELDEDAKFCSKCGFPLDKMNDNPVTQAHSNDSVKSTPQQAKVASPHNRRGIIIACIVVVIIIAVAIIVGFQIKKQRDIQLQQQQQELEEQQAAELAAELAAQESAEYKENLSSVSVLMLSGAALAETQGNLIKNVWHNCIYKKSDLQTNKYTQSSSYGTFYDDFNDALRNLFNDRDFTNKINSLKTNQDDVKSSMKELTNPPDEWADAYSVLQDFYDSYMTLINLVINPSGSLMTYTSNFSAADTDVLNAYQKLQLYLE